MNLRGTSGACAIAALCVPAIGVAQDRFEIQVYDSETAPHLEPGVEIHLNHGWGGASTTSEPPELPTSHVTHLTLEPHLGLGGWVELGGYLQSALGPDGSFAFAGAKLRLKMRWPRKLLHVIGLAVNFELSMVPDVFEANVWGSEVRPVIDFSFERFYASLNPIIGTDLWGPLAGQPQLEPAVKAAWLATPRIALGVEYYAGLGPLRTFGAKGLQRALVAFDYVGPRFDVNVGAGIGWGNGERWLVKAILGIHPEHDVL